MKLPRHPNTPDENCKILSAKIVWMPTDADGGAPYYRVGFQFSPTKRIITAITVTQDLPGPGCYLNRICIWDGETLLLEAPLHNVESVQYVTTDEGETS